MFVVVRQGARLDASGAQAVLDIAGQGAVPVASDGGRISLAPTTACTWTAACVPRRAGPVRRAVVWTLALESPYYQKAAVTDRVLKVA